MKNLILTVLVLQGFTGYSQRIDYNTIILPNNASEIEFSEKLVRLAWQNHPSVGILYSEFDKSNLEVKFSQWNWLDNIRLTGNLNEFNINNPPGTTDIPQFFPRYNFSATISLGDLFTNPIRTKVEKKNVNISLETINQKKLEIRSEVLQRYQNYLSFKEIYDLRVEMVEDAFTDLKLKEQRFAKGEIVINEYTIALERYNLQKITKIQAERDMMISRIELEELIGVKLSEVR